VGNPDLEPETSINKEIGLAFDKGSWRTSATYFRNDYRNKIVGSNQYITRLSNGRRVLQWENTDEAVVEGVEGNLFVALSPQLEWNTNFTYMLESEDKQTGEPLSVIPEYTLNSSLDWQVTQQLSLQLTGTYYGKQEAPSLNRRTGRRSTRTRSRTSTPMAWSVSAPVTSSTRTTACASASATCSTSRSTAKATPTTPVPTPTTSRGAPISRRSPPRSDPALAPCPPLRRAFGSARLRLGGAFP